MVNNDYDLNVMERGFKDLKDKYPPGPAKSDANKDLLETGRCIAEIMGAMQRWIGEVEERINTLSVRVGRSVEPGDAQASADVTNHLLNVVWAAAHNCFDDRIDNIQPVNGAVRFIMGGRVYEVSMRLVE